MFHAHKTEFAELGWMGFFEVVRLMEARGQTVDERGPGRGRRSLWLLGGVPLAIIVAAIALFAALGGPGLEERTGPPVEELAVERTVLRPGEIELTVRNTGPDPVSVAQVFVADAYVDFEATDRELGRLESADAHARLPVAGGLALRDHDRDLDRRDDRPRDRRRGRDAGGRRRASSG